MKSRGWLIFGAVSGAYLLAVALLASDSYLFDDATSLQFNSALRSLDGGASSWRDALLSGVATPFGRILSMGSFALQAALEGGLYPDHLRVVNALLHGLSAVLLMLCARLLFRGLGEARDRAETLALITGLLWFLAPLQLSTVLYPVQRMTQLAALCSAAAYLVYLRWRLPLTEAPFIWPAALRTLIWVVLLTLLGALAKEVALLLPWLIAWTELVVFRGRVARQPHWLGALAVLATLLPPILLLWGWFGGWDVVHGGYRFLDFSAGERLLTELRVLWLYVYWLLLPWAGDPGFVHDDLLVSTGWLQPLTTAVSAAAWSGLLIGALALRRRAPLLLFALGFFLIGHAMESSVLALELAFEHRNYLPSFALALLAAWAIVAATERLQGSMPDLARLLPCLLLLLLVIPLAQRMVTWSDPLMLARSSVAAHPRSPRAYYLLAEALEQSASTRSGDERVAQLLAARESYRTMAAVDGDALAPLVLLHRFDARHFPGNPEQARWVAALTEQLDGAPLAATEFNAVAALLDCLDSRCAAAPEATRRVLRALEQSYAGDLRVQRELYRHYLRTGDGPSSQRILQRIEDIPGSEGLRAQLRLERAMAAQDSGAMLEAVVPLYRRDPGHRRQRWFGAVLGARD